MKTLDICIPTFNEASVIANTLQKVQQAAAQATEIESKIIVSDNGSSDKTAQVVKDLGLQNVIVIYDPNPGKGAAVKRAAETSSADYFAYIDADLSIDPKCIFDFAKSIDQGSDVVLASRLKDQSLVERSGIRTLSSKLYNSFIRAILRIKTLDAQCGLKMMNTEGKRVLLKCEEASWFLDTEFVMLAEHDGLVVEERAVEWVEFRYTGRKSKFNALKGALLMLPATLRIIWRHS